MMLLRLLEMCTRDLVGTTSRSDGEMTVRLIGTVDGRFTADVAQFITQVQAAALANPVERVIVDFQQLEFMNSSCFKAFVTWLQNLLDLEPEWWYWIRFVSNPYKH